MTPLYSVSLGFIIEVPEVRVKILSYLDPPLLKEQVIASLNKRFFDAIVAGRKQALPKFLSGMITYLKKADDGNYPIEIAALEKLKSEVISSVNEFNVRNFRDATNRFNTYLLPLLDTIPLDTMQKSMNLVAYSFLPQHITRFVNFNYLLSKARQLVLSSYEPALAQELIKLGEFNILVRFSLRQTKPLNYLAESFNYQIASEVKSLLGRVCLPNYDIGVVRKDLLKNESINIQSGKIANILVRVFHCESVNIRRLSSKLTCVSSDTICSALHELIKNDTTLINDVFFKEVVEARFLKNFSIKVKPLIENGNFIEAYKKAAFENHCAYLARKYVTLEQMRYIKKMDGFEAALSFLEKKGEGIVGPLQGDSLGIKTILLAAYEECSRDLALHLLETEKKNIQEVYEELVRNIPSRFVSIVLIINKLALHLVHLGKIEEAIFLFCRQNNDSYEYRKAAFEYLFFKLENIEQAFKFLML